MSAFLVTPKTINVIAEKLAESREFTEPVSQVASELLEMNLRALEERYGRDEGSYGYTHQYRHEKAGSLEIYKRMRCYLYQCLEGDVPASALYQEVDRLCNTFAKIVEVEQQKGIDEILDSREYDLIPWE